VKLYVVILTGDVKKQVSAKVPVTKVKSAKNFKPRVAAKKRVPKTNQKAKPHNKKSKVLPKGFGKLLKTSVGYFFFQGRIDSSKGPQKTHSKAAVPDNSDVTKFDLPVRDSDPVDSIECKFIK
jgi:hypothetical protein